MLGYKNKYMYFALDTDFYLNKQHYVSVPRQNRIHNTTLIQTAEKVDCVTTSGSQVNYYNEITNGTQQHNSKKAEHYIERS